VPNAELRGQPEQRSCVGNRNRRAKCEACAGWGCPLERLVRRQMTLPVHGWLLPLAILYLFSFRQQIARPPKLINCNTGFVFLKLPCPDFGMYSLETYSAWHKLAANEKAARNLTKDGCALRSLVMPKPEIFY
jgi:hypothetical protein